MIAREILKVAALIVPGRSAYEQKMGDDAERVEYPEYGIVALYKANGSNGKPVGMLFSGKKSKPDWYYRFNDRSRFDRLVEIAVDNAKKKAQVKNESKQTRVDYKHSLVVGDILESSWGYDQTNASFYQVLAVTDKSVKVRSLNKKVVSDTSYGVVRVVPIPDSFNRHEQAVVKRVSPRGSVKISSYEWASKWDGNPAEQTASGYGH